MGWLSWWLQSTIQGYPRREWERVGVRSEKMLASWWDIGVRSPEHVAAWHRSATSPQHARAWQACGQYSPYEAQRWVDLGFELFHAQAAHARGWDLAEAVDWRSSGIPLPEIDCWLLIGASASEATRLRRSIDHSQVKKWVKHGFTTVADVEAWARLGLGPSDATRWRKAGFSASESLGWMAAGRDVAAAKRARSAGYESSVFIALKERGRPANEAKEWYSLGLASDQIVNWVQMGFTPHTAKPWLDSTVEDPGVAASWLGADFDPDEALGWIGEQFEPAVAAGWRALRNDPDQMVRALGSPASAAPWRDADLQVESAREWVALSVGPTDAHRLEAAGISAADLAAIEWLPAGEPDRSDGLQDLIQWCELGAAVADVGSLRDSWSLATAALWTGRLSLAPIDALAWERTGLPLAVCTAWAGVLFGPTDATAFTAIGVDSAEASAWRSIGVVDVVDVERARARWTALEATKWIPAIAVTEPQAWELHELVGGDLALALSFRRRGVEDQPTIERWMLAFEPSPAPWLEAGFDDLEVALSWHTLNVQPADAREWLNTGFALDDAPEWMAIGMDPATAAKWSAAVGSAQATLRWLENGILSPADALASRALNLEPTDSSVLLRLGLSPSSLSDLPEHERIGAAKTAAMARCGLRYTPSPPSVEVDVADLPPEDVLAVADHALAAAAAVGECTLRIRHGAPKLDLRAVRLLPEARYVRGGQKAELWCGLLAGRLSKDPPLDTDPGGETTTLTIDATELELADLLASIDREIL